MPRNERTLEPASRRPSRGARLAGPLGLVLLVLLLAGCLGTGDPAAGPGTAQAPEAGDAGNGSWARALPPTIEAVEPVSTVAGVPTGRGIATHGDHVYATGAQGFHVVDVSNTSNPTVVASLPELGSRGVDLLHYDSGRTVAVLATQANGMKFVDVTTPSQPDLLASILEDRPVHNVAVVPGTTTVYNSRSVSTRAEQGIDIVDASDPEDPEFVRFADEVLNCHDVEFRAASERAYCAGGFVASEIWDVSDPEDPTVVSRVPNPTLSHPHWATHAREGDLMIVGDEFAGAFAYGCGPRASTPTEATGDVSDPVGALWFYDVSDEENPELLSWLSVDVPADDWDGDPRDACTAHFGDVIQGRDKLVVGWFTAGTFLLDFSDPTAPMVKDRWRSDSSVWDARVHNGYVFTGDGNRGVDVLRLAGGS